MGPDAVRVERALAGKAAHHDDLSARTGLPVDQVAVAIEELVDAGRDDDPVATSGLPERVRSLLKGGTVRPRCSPRTFSAHSFGAPPGYGRRRPL